MSTAPSLLIPARHLRRCYTRVLAALLRSASLRHAWVTVVLLLLGQIAAAQDKCRTESCRYYPALRCKMNKDRWEYVGGEEAYMPRYRIPYCNRWDFLEGDVITIVSFHQLQSHVHVTQPELYWMHTAFYGFAVPTPSLHGDTSAEIPHTVDFIPSKTYEAQMGKHAGWWNTDKAISPGDHSADVRVTAYDQGYQGSKFGW